MVRGVGGVEGKKIRSCGLRFLRLAVLLEPRWRSPPRKGLGFPVLFPVGVRGGRQGWSRPEDNFRSLHIVHRHRVTGGCMLRLARSWIAAGLMTWWWVASKLYFSFCSREASVTHEPSPLDLIRTRLKYSTRFSFFNACPAPISSKVSRATWTYAELDLVGESLDEQPVSLGCC